MLVCTLNLGNRSDQIRSVFISACFTGVSLSISDHLFPYFYSTASACCKMIKINLLLVLPKRMVYSAMEALAILSEMNNWHPFTPARATTSSDGSALDDWSEFFLPSLNPYF